MAGTGIMAGIYSSPSPSRYPIEKIGDSPSKRRRVRTIRTGTSLFVISTYKWRNWKINWII